MIQRCKWPGLALLLGVAAALTRRWQLATAFEETLGLHEPGSVSSWVLVALLAACAALFLVLARLEPARPAPSAPLSAWDCALAAPKDLAFLTAMALAALLTLAAIPTLFQEASQLRLLRTLSNGDGESGLLQVMVAVVAVPAAAALVYTGASGFKLRGRGRENLALLLPPLLSCVWLLEGYRDYAADPVLWYFAPLVLAIAVGLLFQMEVAGLAFSPGHPRRLLWLAAMTVVVSAVALATLPERAMLALLSAQTLTALAVLWVVPEDLRRPPEPSQFGGGRTQTPAQPENSTKEDPEDPRGPQEIQEEDAHV